ncbi:AEC family transporter [Desulfogranum japonicum]|uniref:AEC family transporter n=1 Tax=Desulfogranum japonicum TaxID=231447 RepID=UPI00040F0826|nr:AEC family transporter [Desulfogranum japonicum]
MIFSTILSILTPVFTCVLIGYFWVRSGRSYDTELITALVTLFGAPCLVFYSLSSVELHPQHLIHMGLAAVFANIAFLALGWLGLSLLHLPKQAFLQALSFPNIGNVGLPLCFLTFGEEGLALGITFFAVYMAIQMTFGVVFVSQTFSLWAILKTPIIPATLAAALFLMTGTAPPKWLYNTTKLIGDLTIPLMLITLGVSLYKLKITQLKIPVQLSVFRLLMGFLVGLTLPKLMGLDGTAASVILLQCSMPAAVFCYLLAQMYDQRPEEVAGVVIVSTIMGFSLLPFLLWYVL